jgi:hypothetical protein
VRQTTLRVVVVLLVTIVLVGLTFYFFHPTVLVVPLPAVAILASVGSAHDRQLSRATVLVVFGSILLLWSAVFPTVLAPQFGLELDAYPGLGLFVFLITGIPGALMLLIGGMLLFSQFRRSRLHLALYEQGVVLDQLGGHRIYTWNELAAVRQETRGRGRGQQRVYVLRPKRGRAFALTERFRDGRHIGEVLLKVFASAQLPS